MKKKPSPKPTAVNFNQALNLTYLKTAQLMGKRKKDIDNPKLFLSASCYFNFQHDFIEFMLFTSKEKLKDIKIQTPIVHFKFSNYDPVIVPIISSELKNDISTITVRANFKDVILHLFKADRKEFLLTISYTDKNKKKYASSFSVKPPEVLKSDWKPNKLILKEYYPGNFCGVELKILFEKHFSNYPAITSKELELLQNIQNYQAANIDDRFNKLDFLAMFQYMTAIEDMEATDKLRDQSVDFARIFKFKSCPRFLRNKVQHWVDKSMKKDEYYSNKIHIIQTKKKLPVDEIDFSSVHLYDQQEYQKHEDDHRKLKELRITAEIDYIIDNLVIIKIYRPEKPKKLPKIKLGAEGFYHVDFIPNRACFRITQRALEDMKNMKIQPYLQNFETSKVMKRGSKIKFDKLEWLSSTIKTNKEQMIAVENILNCTSFPSPFIIFGGPGTGKSTTIVEAIAQIVKMKPDSRVLFTAGSNSTCDDIGNRLAKHVSVNKILRIYAPSFEKKTDKIDEFFIGLSNFHKDEKSEEIFFEDPSVLEFLTARVIIVTIVSVGRIVNANYLTDHFDYIFIGELILWIYFNLKDLFLILNFKLIIKYICR
jgi:hypothetical protein